MQTYRQTQRLTSTETHTIVTHRQAHRNADEGKLIDLIIGAKAEKQIDR